ncbi:hypothetical protein [Streptomyces atratus]|uniref:hypothetical protein n=1 Tax=Streptomyces atratus TaxID=1893 RepID=UPI0036464233
MADERREAGHAFVADVEAVRDECVTVAAAIGTPNPTAYGEKANVTKTWDVDASFRGGASKRFPGEPVHSQG